jgi:hypothetical protein
MSPPGWAGTAVARGGEGQKSRPHREGEENGGPVRPFMALALRPDPRRFTVSGECP